MLYTFAICTYMQTLCCYSEYFRLPTGPVSSIFCFFSPSKLIRPFIFWWSYLKYATISRLLGAFCKHAKRKKCGFCCSFEWLARFPPHPPIPHCTHYLNLHVVHGGINTDWPLPPKRNEKLAKSCSRGLQQELLGCSFAEQQVKRQNWDYRLLNAGVLWEIWSISQKWLNWNVFVFFFEQERKICTDSSVLRCKECCLLKFPLLSLWIFIS